ncbi:heat-shock protein HspX [Sulfolobus sp. S-194]|uniref:M56 family metallopeptidase n=1 Tax=Sulfolobus sp. S-194 TaxID=2512240 RepID=UPI001436FFB0|nr:M56 family metallopeptidase [Sulfolobus sp. S-194]QIW24424.1 heat-shock protein HspX [Sulfolobus sp. S-194]
MWWRYYFISFAILLALSLILSNFVPLNFYLECGEISLIFFIWYLLSPLIMIFSFKLRRSEDERLNSLISYTASIFRMNKPIIYVANTDYSNAFAFGNFFYKAIGYTSGLLSSLQDNEIIGVTAHELAHLKNHDMEIQVLGLILYNILYLYLFNIDFILGLVTFALAYPLFIFIHRMLEKKADLTAVKNNRWLTIYLENALIKIGYLGRSIPSYLLRDIPDFQLYFIKQQLMSNNSRSIFRTHPSLSERLRYLSKYEAWSN